LIPTKLEQGMSAQDVMEKLSKSKDKNKKERNGINVIVLDTCRNFSQVEADRKSLAEQRKLVEVGGSSNTFIVFSTSSGEKSPEGEPGEGSPFARYLQAAIENYHWLPLEDLFQEVGEDVRAKYSEHNKYKDAWVYVYGSAGRHFCLSRCLSSQNITVTP
jgi:hypothetical protein